MIESAAIEQIKSLVLAAAGKRVDDTLTPLILLPKDVSMNSLEGFLANRVRFRGKLQTESIQDFARYVIKRTNAVAAKTPKGFIGINDNLSCEVIFNIGDESTAGHCDDLAMLLLMQSAPFKAMNKVIGVKMNQRALAEWIEDWANNLRAISLTDEGEESSLALARTVVAVRKVTLEAISRQTTEVGDMSASRSALDSIAATSTETLPSVLIFSAIPYEGLQSRDFRLRVSIITGEREPIFVLRWAKQEAQIEEIAQEFKEKLNTEIGGFTDLFIGSFAK